ncbi:MurR/RpiR family transcriptional regulator [Pseudolactococcus plantarum]|uniref:MurR/RpiR family transcriptional regulator n=1 Tax=Pseudolactococcus plantarum TaxID=1365 RepID=UPI00082E6DF7|nr:MurR/RpiR family transcriptional regulator [Lactococcus plantarum]HCN73972.1 MurR/RpiR family transcriptional regulator [Lactococcus sp.]
MDTLLLIREKYTTFTTVEKRIADYIFESGELLLEKSVQEASQAIGSSSASLVRFSRTLGYDGFSQFKQKLSIAYAMHVDNKDYFEEVSDSETPSSIKKKLKVRMNQMVETTNTALSDKTLLTVASCMEQAEIIYVYGIGASAIVAQDLSQKFSRIGKQVLFIQDPHLLVVDLSVEKERALFIGISMNGNTKEVVDIGFVSKQLQVPIVAITAKEDSNLGKLATHILHSISGENFQMRTAATMDLMAQLYVVDILFYLYLSEHFDQSYEKLQITRQAVELLQDQQK